MMAYNIGEGGYAALALSVLALALIVIQTSGVDSPETTTMSVPQGMKFVRLRLGRKTNAGAGDLGQSITSYYVHLDIGTPPKPFTMLVDVNARENFVPHYLKLGLFYSNLNFRNGYCKKDSRTSEKEEAETLTVSYQGCVLSGKAYTDRFELRQVKESYKMVAYRQRFLAMSKANNDRFARYAVDGVLALNPWPISATGSELLTVGLARADLMGELKFGLHLALDETDQGEDTESAGGELILGAVNPTKFLGALRYHQLVAQHAWELPLAGVMLGGSPVGNTNAQGTQWLAILSTSSNGITGPARPVGKILGLLGVGQDSNSNSTAESQSKLYAFDCDKRQSAPDLSFVIEDARYTIPSTAYIKVKPASIFRKATCYLDLYSNYAEENKWELGTDFLSNFYTVFDVNSRKVALGSLHVQKS